MAMQHRQSTGLVTGHEQAAGCMRLAQQVPAPERMQLFQAIQREEQALMGRMEPATSFISRWPAILAAQNQVTAFPAGAAELVTDLLQQG